MGIDHGSVLSDAPRQRGLEGPSLKACDHVEDRPTVVEGVWNWLAVREALALLLSDEREPVWVSQLVLTSGREFAVLRQSGVAVFLEVLAAAEMTSEHHWLPHARACSRMTA